MFQEMEAYKKCIDNLILSRSLNAFITECFGPSLLQAKAAQERLESGKKLGPLDGKPVSFKDNFSTAGIRTTCASKMLSNYIPPYDATVVKKLMAAGAVLMGKNNMDEFSMGVGSVDSVFGPVRNVWKSGLKYQLKWKDGRCSTLDPCADAEWFVAGGSSGGCTTAVAAGAVYASIGSDTGGSARNPAAHCGVVGLKPTYGSVSRHGLVPLVNSLDVPSILSKRVDGVADVYNCVHGHDVLDSTTVEKPLPDVQLVDRPSVSGIKVGIPKEFHCPNLSKEVLDVWSQTAEAMEASGACLSQVSLPYTQFSISCYSVLNACDVASNMARYDGLQYGHRSTEDTSSTDSLYAASRSQGFNEVVRGRILAGNYFLLRKPYERYFLQAARLRRLIARDYERAFDDVDVLLAPITLQPPLKYKQFIRKDNRTNTAQQDFCTQPVNMAGVPAVSVPVCLSKDDTPIGLQVIGRWFDEQTVLNVAKWLEQTMDFPDLILLPPT